MKTRSSDRYAMLLAGVAGGSLLFSTAMAQETATDEAADTVERTEQVSEETESRQEKVVVTGSLLRRDEYSSASPIQVINAEVSTLEGLVDTADILQGSSVAAGSVQFNNQFNGFVVEGGTGIQSISLRGLGAQRSLVLLNGRRPGPAGTRGQVGSFDLNVIPRSVITQVDILKDGASSIYGSDAVAGVANIITRTSVDEPEITVQYNQPFEDGGEQFSIDGAYGLNFDTGNIVLAAQYTLQEDLSVGDRDFLKCPQDIVFDASSGERIDREDRSILAGTSLGGCSSGNVYHNTVIDLFSGLRYIPAPDGVTQVSNPFGLPAPGIEGYRPRANEGYDGPGGQAFYEDVLNNERYLTQDAINKNETTSFYATSDFELDILGGINWDTEFLYTRRDTQAEGWRQFFPQIGGATVGGFGLSYANDPGYDNPYQTLALPVMLFPSNTDIEVDYYSIATGVEGEFNLGGAAGGFFDDWAWSADFVTSKSDGSYGGLAILASESGDINFDSDAPNYDPFDPAVLSGEDTSFYDVVGSNEVGNTTYEQTLINAIVTGPLFSLPAGDVQIALGTEWREFSIDDQPSEASQNGDLWGSSSAQVTKGEDNVVEWFTELEVPLLKGAPLAEEVSLNGSFRTFNYASYGVDDVYKLGLNWQVNPTLRLRATQGTSYRAPALYELFLGNQTSFLGQTAIDPCIDWGNSSNENIRTNCAADGIPADYAGASASATIISGGGRDVLDAETSDATTIGLVYTPTFSDLSIAIDYFEITVNDQVGQLGASAILGGCYAAENFPNAFCDLFGRTPGDSPDQLARFGVTEVNDSFINVNEQTTEGIDISARYQRSFDFGDIIGELQATRTLEDIQLLFDSQEESGFETDDFNGTIGDPEWVANGRVSLERGDFTYSWLFDYVGETSNAVLFDDLEFSYFGRDATQIYDAESRFYHDISVQWEGDKITITGGIANLLDEEPPVISDGTDTRRGNVPLVGQYDIIGRTAFVRATKRF
ncbi:MAG: TonB-dependent receptor [Alphaproteobacteria bacterium]|jgi:iron complex outermembrane receptor protein|nr:TonB-dependent receptor [Alphaproteobacteria bacterium]